MADENSPETSPAADDPSASVPKKDTVRITIPPQPQETPMVKRETVHIGLAPKKETTGISGTPPLLDTSATVPPPPAATRPLMPPLSAPPRPPAAPGMPPPSGARPGMPPIAPKPVAPGASAAAPKAASYAEVKPVTIKAAPKKETARIQVAPTQKLPPQATVRLSQPSQSLSAGPAPAIRTAAAPAATTEVAGEDKIVTYLSLAAAAVALAAAVLGYMAYSA